MALRVISHAVEHDTTNGLGSLTVEAQAEQGVSRRVAIVGGLSSLSFALLRCGGEPLRPEVAAQTALSAEREALLGFDSVPPALGLDAVVVPSGYSASVLYAWGEPISDGPQFAHDASNSSAEQEQQAGMHHDGMHYFPLNRAGHEDRGLLVINHEYTDDGLLHVGGMNPWTPEKVAKSQAAHGVSVVEVAFRQGKWEVVRPSVYARRITARTPIAIAGPLRGHSSMRTAANPTGDSVLGTLNNCASGHTPWGTYLTCEENWHGYFVNPLSDIPGAPPHKRVAALRNQARYGIDAEGAGYRWHDHDERFNAALHPNEPNRFGWVVEVDPFKPNSQPIKRTALGRFKHEGATVVESKGQHLVVYMGDDERFEYIYKFVSKQPWRKGVGSPLDEGTLYVAQFAAGGAGRWVALVQGAPGLTADQGFETQADILLETRRAADAVGATKMDRPEWIAVHPKSGEVYCTLSNNNRRGTPGHAAVDAANPRSNNTFGHIVRWREAASDPAATQFEWDTFVLCGNPESTNEQQRGSIKGDAFGSPDGLVFDGAGRLWIQTDVTTNLLGIGDYAALGNNQMLVSDPITAEVRRFLSGPQGCEVTGFAFAPDNRTLFVNIQHPGERASGRSDPTSPKAVSSWPDGAEGGRPRSATVAIRRTDGGVVGT